MVRFGSVIVLALGVGGCEGAAPSSAEESSGPGACGQTSCSDLLVVSLVAEAGVLVGGSYAVAWSFDGVDDDCAFTIEGEAEQCGGDPPCTGANDCPADFGFTSMPQFVALNLEGAPELFEITVFRGGEPVLQTGFAPQYEDFHPNGVDCPPVCARASATLDLP